MFAVAAKNQTLVAASGIAYAALHSAWPDVTGVNEVGLSRVALVWNAPANGRRQTSGGFGVTVPGNTTVAWVGFWSALTGGVFQGSAPLGGLVYDVATVLATGRIVIPGHPFVDNQAIVFYGGTPPAPLVQGTTYYVRDAIVDQFRVAQTPGGSFVPLTLPAANSAVVSSINPLTITGAPGVINVPRVTLRWDPNYPPVWDTGVTQIDLQQGQTFDLRTICSDRNLDTLVFAIASDSAPLPAGVSLAANGILTATAGATVGPAVGIYFTADDLQ